MSSTTTLLYPTCYMKYRVASVASLFLEKVLVMVPSEENINVARDTEINSMKIRPLVISPLGEKLEDFQKGLKALEAWGKQMGLGRDTGFDTLYSALSGSENEDIHGIINAIKGGTHDDIIMASRVFLRLSLDTDQKMDDLDRELSKIGSKESIISGLVDGTEQEESATAGAGGFIEPLNKAEERLKAWTRIFFTGSALVDACCPMGESVSTKDLMDTAYETLTGGNSPVTAAEFSVPHSVLTEHCQDDITGKIRPVFATFLNRMNGLSGKEITEIAKGRECTEMLREIQSFLESGSSAGDRAAVATMSVILYPEYSWQDVLLKAGNLPGDKLGSCPMPPTHLSLFVL